MTTGVVGSRLSGRHKAIILATCCLSLLIVSMDATIVNVALPSISGDLDASVTDLQWVIDIYTLVLASLLMVSGAVADRFGRRRVFQIGLVTFAVGSLACSLAPSVGLLIAARALQAVGGSMLNPVAMSIITQVFVDPRERARAIGLWGAVVGVSMGLGPIVGGVLIDVLSWRSVFWINLPVCTIAIVLTAVFVPESRSEVRRRIDPLGPVLATIALGGLVFGLIEGPEHGWTSPLTISPLVAAVIAAMVFIWWERRHEDPFLNLSFFRSVPFSSAAVIAICAFSAYGAFLFLMSIYLQSSRGLSAVATGAMLLPLAVATLLCSPISGWLVGRFGPRISLVAAGCGLAVSAVAMITFDGSTPLWALGIAFGIFGIGFGTVNAPITNSAVSGMPRHQAGAASAVASTSRQVGVSIGVALAGSLTGAVGAGFGADFSDAMNPMWILVLILGLAIAVIGVVSTTPHAEATARRVARDLFGPNG